MPSIKGAHNNGLLIFELLITRYSSLYFLDTHIISLGTLRLLRSVFGTFCIVLWLALVIYDLNEDDLYNQELENGSLV